MNDLLFVVNKSLFPGKQIPWLGAILV